MKKTKLSLKHIKRSTVFKEKERRHLQSDEHHVDFLDLLKRDSNISRDEPQDIGGKPHMSYCECLN